MKKLLTIGAVAAILLVAAPASADTCITINSTLAVGSSNASVTQLQDFLRGKGFLSAASTGYYGSLTASAVKNFQIKNGLAAVGSVGPMTRALIHNQSCVLGASTATPSPAPTPAPTPAPEVTTPALPALPYKSQDFSAWKGTWGDVTNTDGLLHVNSTVATNGASAYFPLGSEWTNYTYTANVNASNGSITLMARYVDDGNFLFCTFAKNWVSVGMRSKGVSTTYNSTTVDGMLPNTSGGMYNTTLSMRVQGNTIGCSGYGPNENITYTVPNTSLQKGSIGLQSWFDTVLAAKLDLVSVSVQPL